MIIKDDNALIDLYIYSIKSAYNDLVTNYKWLKSHYKRIRKYYKLRKKRNVKQQFYSTINKYFNQYEDDLYLIFSLMDNTTPNLINLDFKEVTTKFLQDNNLSLKALCKLYKMIDTIINRKE